MVLVGRCDHNNFILRFLSYFTVNFTNFLTQSVKSTGDLSAMAFDGVSVGWRVWRELNGLSVPRCERCRSLAVGCLCRRCMARFDAERLRRGLVDESLRSVASEWERSEWVMPLGEGYEAAAEWYERRCGAEAEDGGVTGVDGGKRDGWGQFAAQKRGRKSMKEWPSIAAAKRPKIPEFARPKTS